MATTWEGHPGAISSRRPSQKAVADWAVGPISKPLREAALAAIASGEFNVYSLARRSGLDRAPLRNVLDGRGDIMLASTAKLFDALGLALKPRAAMAETHCSLTEALLAAVAASGLNPHALGIRSGVDPKAVRGFVQTKGGMMLANADKVACFLELEVIRRAEIWPAEPKAAGRPLSDALRSEITERCPDLLKLSKATGVSRYSLKRHLEGDGDLILTSVDRIFEFLALAVVRDSGGEGGHLLQTPSDAVRSALCGEVSSLSELARRTGGHSSSLTRFARREGGMMLSSADGVAQAEGLKVVQGTSAARPEPKPTPLDDSLRTLNDFLRSICEARRVGCNDLARKARVSPPTVSRFLNQKRDLDYNCAMKVAHALNVGLGPATHQILQAEQPTPAEPPFITRRCPVELREGSRVFLDGKPLADLNGEACDMLGLLVVAFEKADPKVPASKLASLAESGRLRPLTKALDRPDLKPLRERIRETKEGRIKFLEIIP